MRLRIHYEKNKELRYTSALDLQKIWERSFRRAEIGLEYTQGYHPHPKMQLALPLPLGFISNAEILDVWISAEITVAKIFERLLRALPTGLELVKIEFIVQKEEALINRIKSVGYSVILQPDKYDLLEIKNKISAMLTENEINRIRRNKTYDLRPLILNISINEIVEDEISIEMMLLAKPGQTGRPDEVLTEMGISLTDCLIKRSTINYL